MGSKLARWNEFSHYQVDFEKGIIRLYSIRFPLIARDAWQPPESHLFHQATSHLNQYLPAFPPSNVPWHKSRPMFVALSIFPMLILLFIAVLIYSRDYTWGWVYYLVAPWVMMILLNFSLLEQPEKEATPSAGGNPGLEDISALLGPPPLAPPLPAPPPKKFTEKKASGMQQYTRWVWIVAPLILLIVSSLLEQFLDDTNELFIRFIQIVIWILFVVELVWDSYPQYKRGKVKKEVTKAIQQGHYETALNTLDSAQTLWEDITYLQYRAYILYLKGDFKTALNTISEDIHTKTKTSEDSSNAPPKKYFSNWLPELSILSNQSKFPTSYWILGQIYLAQKDYQKAQAAFRYALHSLDEKAPLPCASLAYTYAMLEDKKAVPLAEYAVKQYTHHPLSNLAMLDGLDAVWFDESYLQLVLAWAIFKQEDAEKGLSILEKEVADFDTENLAVQAALHYHLGLMHQTMDNRFVAQEAFNKVLALDPEGRWKMFM